MNIINLIIIEINSIRNFYCHFFLSVIFIGLCYSGFGQTDANVPLRGITVYIDYPDVPANVTNDQLDSLINGINYQEPGIQRTFRKYWHEQTRRNIVMHHDVFFYTAPLPSSYYESLGWQDGILLWRDALEWIINTNPGFDWSSLNINSEGSLSSVMIISSKWGPAGVGAAHYPNWTLSNGKKVTRIYGSVFMAPWDFSNNMFMTLHESGHGIFALPDTYDTNYDSGGTSFYTVMSGGANDVEPVGGPFLVQHNWGTIVEKEPGTHSITLRADGDSVFVFRNLHDSLEFFTVEARKQSTIGNSLFPAPIGLLIWHSDTKVNTSNTLQNMTPLQHYAHSIEQADGLFELEASLNNSGDIGDIFLPGDEFSDITTPNSKWWDSGSSDFELSDIEFIGTDQVRFTVIIPSPHEDHYAEIAQDGWSLVSETPSQAGYDGSKAFDGDVTTYYHVPWGNNYPRPHELVIDLGASYTVNEFYYTANKNDAAPWEGRINEYEIYLSEDNLNWGPAVATGTFFQTGIRQYVLFENVTGRYLKFSALSSFPGVENDVRTSIAEINLRGFDPSLVSVDDDLPKDAFMVYPNPSSGQFTIQLSTDHAEISVLNMVGQQILYTQTMQKLTDLHIENSGVYLICVKTNLGVTTQRVVVNR